MGRSCKVIREDLANCLLHSDCMFVKKKSARECLKNKDELPEECKNLIEAYGECKRQMVR